MRRLLLATTVTVSLLAAGPVLAAGPTHAPCSAPAGANVVKPGSPVTLTPTTPVGALDMFEEPVGDFYLDLGGKSVQSTGTLEFTLSWTNSDVSDYDLVINGTNDFGSDYPEVITAKGGHCKKITVGVDVFVGLPIDELTLVAKATSR